MSFDEYYDSIFAKRSSIVQKSCDNEIKSVFYKGGDFRMSIQSIELLDGFRLDFGSYKGNFSNVISQSPKSSSLHFGICLSGEYSGFFKGKRRFSLGINDVWSCSMHDTMHSVEHCECSTISFSIDVRVAYKELKRFLKSLDLIYMHDSLVDNPSIFPANSVFMRLFGNLCLRYNSDILRLNSFSLLMKLSDSLLGKHNYSNTEQNNDYHKDIYNYIQKYYCKDLSLEFFAQMHNVSLAKLTRDFMRVYNISIYSFIKQCRMQKAYNLLKEGSNVTQSANEVGYTNISAFCKSFRETFGKNPSMLKKLAKDSTL